MVGSFSSTPSWATPIRKERLEKLVRISSGKNYIKVVLDSKIDRAFCKGNTIHITSSFIPNKVYPGMSDDLWMLLAQKALAMHELGHVLWSNFTYRKKIHDELKENHGQFVADIFLQISAILEDARVDRGIAYEFPGAGFYIRKLRENDSLLLQEKLHKKDEVELTNPLFQFFVFLYDQLIYNTGVFEWLRSGKLHPVVPKLVSETNDLINRALIEPDGREVQKIYRDITLKIVEVLREEGLLMLINFIPVVEFDESKASGAHQKKLLLPKNSAPDLLQSLDQVLNGSLNDSESSDEVEESGSIDLNEWSEENREKQILKELRRELNQEITKGTDIEEIEKSVADYELRVFLPEPNYRAYSRFNEERIRSVGNIIARSLTILRERTKGGWKSRMKSGRLHTKRLWKLSSDDYRVFKKKLKEKELNYQCFILLDRSASMFGNKIYHAEYATLILCYALEKVGIQTEVVGFNSISIDLNKTLNESFESAKYRITQLWADGFTPTHRALRLVKRRISKLATKNPFIIIITDGYPDLPEVTVEEIKACPYPVVGVTILESSQEETHIDWEKIYHAEVKVRSVDELLPALVSLVKKFMF